MTRKSSTKVTTTKAKTSPSKRTSRKRTSSTSLQQRMAKFDEEINTNPKKVSVKVTKTVKPVSVTKPVAVTPKKVTKTVSPTKSASKPVIVEDKVAPTPKPVVEAKPELIKPDVKLISFEDYVQDIKNRIAIHNYEFALFVRDCQNGYQSASKFVVEGYNKQFNL